MPVEFVTIDRDTPYLLPQSVQDYLPEAHLARFVAEMVDQLDMSALLGVYAGSVTCHWEKCSREPFNPLSRLEGNRALKARASSIHLPSFDVF